MTLLDDIAAFVEAHGMSESTFGILAVRDKNLIKNMRGVGRSRPRRLYPETEAAVRRFMATYLPDRASRSIVNERNGQ